MTAQLVHIPNPLMPELGTRLHELKSGLTVTQAIERAGLRLRYSTVLVRGGAMVKRAEWDSMPIAEGELVTLVTLPQDGGGGDSSKVLAVIALIVLAVVAPHIIGPTLLGSKILADVAVAAIVVTGQVLISAVLPAPQSFKPAQLNRAGSDAHAYKWAEE